MITISIAGGHRTSTPMVMCPVLNSIHIGVQAVYMYMSY